MSRTAEAVARIRPGRKIVAISAVLLPFSRGGDPDLDGFQVHVARTHRAGLKVAVNMDTGFGPQLDPGTRERVLAATREALGPGVAFVAGAMPFGDPGDPLQAYRNSVRAIVEAGGVPIVFPSEFLAGKDGAGLAELLREITAGAPQALAFELGAQFAPFGRIFDEETFRRVLDIPNIVGVKHSSLSRAREFARLRVRDAARPDFRIYTGNDLAIDMVMYGSDYLLGLSTFDPDAFARRDRWWEEGDERFFDLNDALQALGAVAFRDPVPAYKASAAAYLKLTGGLPDPRPHPACPPRPSGEADLLRPFAGRIASPPKG